MIILVIGTAAMRQYLPGCREPKDLDVFSPNRFPGWLAEAFWDITFFDWLPEGTVRFASLDELYTIKVSHAYWELHGTWNKHMFDVLQLQRAGANLDQDLHDLLYRVWVERHGAKRLNLNQESGQFFTDAVRRVYDHDSIHYSVAYGERPLYEEVRKDGQTVAVDMKKVWALPFDDQVRLFREEVYATALERMVIPKNYRCSPGLAYSWALRRTITSLTKGKSAQFMVENFDLFRKPDMDYVGRHLANKHKLIPLKV